MEALAWHEPSGVLRLRLSAAPELSVQSTSAPSAYMRGGSRKYERASADITNGQAQRAGLCVVA